MSATSVVAVAGAAGAPKSPGGVADAGRAVAGMDARLFVRSG